MSVTMLSHSSNSSSTSSPKGTDIVKQGYLFIKRPPQNGFLRFKSWHKRYFVLHDETMDHPSHLEMYQKEADFYKNSSRKFVLYLDNVIHVGRSRDSKRFPQAFIIVCSGRAPIILAEDDPLYANSWLLAVTLIGEKGRQSGLDGTFLRHCNPRFSFPPGSIEYRRLPSGDLQDFLDEVPLNACYSESLLEDITVKKYDVTIEATKASRRNNIEGDYQLVVRSWGLSLVRPGKDDYIVHWPLCFIRKFKSEFLPHASKKKATLVTLELGRRCVTGEGVLQFRTRHGREIVADMNQAICNSMSNKLVMNTVVKGRPLFRSSSSSKGNSSVNNCGAWKSTSSSRASSLSRQSSGGTSRSLSGPSMTADSSLHVVDLMGILRTSTSSGNIIENSIKLRSPLKSDSSSDSKTMGDLLLTSDGGISRASVSSLLSTSSGHSSASDHSAASSESAEYIQAEFTSTNRSRLFASLTEDTSSSPVRTRNMMDKKFVGNSIPPHVRRSSKDIGNVSETSKAEAEGYLEVLPDMSVFNDSKDIFDGDDLSNIYHIMDFSKRSRSSSPTSSKGTMSQGMSRSNRKSELNSSSCRTLQLVEEPSIGVGLALIDKTSLHRRSHCGIGSFSCVNGKPPAPLPRPEYTIP